MRGLSCRARHPRRPAVVGVVALLLAVAAPSQVVPAGADDLGVTVTATPTTVSDGQAVRITVKAAPGRIGSQIKVSQCRSGVEYQVGGRIGPAADFAQGGENCPNVPISSSTVVLTGVDGFGDAAERPDGLTFLHRVGVGRVTWLAPQFHGQCGGSGQPSCTHPAELTCDPTHPCSLVLQAKVGGVWRPFVFDLTFSDNNPFAGCGGGATGALDTGGPDRMTEAWVNWTIAECKVPGRTGAAGRGTFVGEGDAVESFAAGSLDLAYSAGGYNEEIGLAPPADSLPEGGARAAVVVPISLNAGVLAVAGGPATRNGVKPPFVDIRLTLEEVALLLSGGQDGFEFLPDVLGPIRERNPELVETPFFLSGTTDSVLAYAGAEATSWYLTRWLTQLAPDAWEVPDNVNFAPLAGTPRGIDVQLAVAEPPYAHGGDGSLLLVSGRESVRKVVFRTFSISDSTNFGGVWVFTDLATAKALGLTPVRIQNANREFVAPTPETMLAAVPSMTRDDAGIRIPDPQVVGAAGEPVQPYPLTFVENALAPAEPLLGQDCSRRDPSQALLAGWLRHIVGPGQGELPDGMVRLPEDMRAEAEDAVGRVGASPVTGACEGLVETITTTTSVAPTTTMPATGTAGGGASGTGGTGGAGSGSTGAGSNASSGVGSSSGSSGTGAAGSDDGGLELVSRRPADTPVVPAFAGRTAAAMGGTILALFGIMAIGGLAAATTGSGRLLPWRRRPPSRPPGRRPPAAPG